MTTVIRMMLEMLAIVVDEIYLLMPFVFICFSDAALTPTLSDARSYHLACIAHNVWVQGLGHLFVCSR